MKKKVLKLAVLVMGIVCVFGGRSYADASSVNCTINGQKYDVKSLSLQINYQDDENNLKEYINDKDNAGNTPVHSACKNGYTNIVKILTDAGADVNIKDNEGNAPLHSACEKGYIEMVKILLQAGANVNEKDGNGNTALNLIFSRFDVVNKDIVELLIANGTNIALKNDKDYTALDSLYMVLNSEYKKCEAYKRYSGCPGYSEYSIYNKHKNNVSYLITITEAVLENTNLLDTVKNENGDNLLNFACKHGYENIASLLVNKK